MTEKKRKILYWGLKILSIIVSCALPIFAICEKFPIWSQTEGTSRSVGVGAILAVIVLLIVFRRTVFDFLSEKVNLKHAPPIVVWVVLLIISYVLVYLGNIMKDMTTVLWMGLIGCSIGTFLTYLSHKFEVTSDE
jgi:amino acid transporter